MGTAVNAELVGDALLMAFQRRRPTSGSCTTPTAARPTSLAFSSLLAELALDQSFRAVGSCERIRRRLDNRSHTNFEKHAVA